MTSGLYQNEKDTKLKQTNKLYLKLNVNLLKMRTFIGIKEKQYTKPKSGLGGASTWGRGTLNFLKSPLPLHGHDILTYSLLTATFVAE